MVTRGTIKRHPSKTLVNGTPSDGLMWNSPLQRKRNNYKTLKTMKIISLSLDS